MSEQFESPDFVEKVISFWDLIKEQSPNLMKGISEHGSFYSEENTEHFLEQLDISTQAGQVIDSLFIRGKYDVDIQVWNNYRLQEATKLTGLLESLSEWSDAISDGQELDLKACLKMRLDDAFYICMRREVFKFQFSGTDGIAEAEGFESRLRYEVVLTSKPEEIDWSAVNLYD